MPTAEHNDYYPKVEYPGHNFLKDIGLISNLIFAIQTVTIMQEIAIGMRIQYARTISAISSKRQIIHATHLLCGNNLMAIIKGE
jgi:hypothetical protein